MSSLGIIGVLLLAMFPLVMSKSVRLNSGNTHCFVEGIPAGTPVDFSFKVMTGDANRVYVKITGLDLKDFYHVEETPAGNFSFVAPEHGNYKFCFQNSDPVSTKTIDFTIDVGETPTEEDPVEVEDPNFPCPSISSKADPLIRELLSTVRSLEAFVNRTLQRFEEKISKLEDAISKRKSEQQVI